MPLPPTDTDNTSAGALKMRIVNAACVVLCAFAVAFELLALWAIVTANARAQRQADAVIAAVKRASAVEFSLQPQTLYRYNQLHHDGRSSEYDAEGEAVRTGQGGETTGVVVTGRLVPRLSEDTGRLRFDGHMRVRRNVSLPSSRSSSSSSSSSSSTLSSWSEATSAYGEEVELLVLEHQRGARFSTLTTASQNEQAANNDGMKCLLPRDVPPLYTVEAASQTAFTAQSFASFGAHCKRGQPVEVLFDRLPFVLCALDWLNDLEACVAYSTSATSRRYHQPSLSPTPTPTAHNVAAVTKASSCNKVPPLVIYGDRVVLEATLVYSLSEAERSLGNTKAMTHCQLLEAPMTTASLATQSVLFHLLPHPTLLTLANVSSAVQSVPLV